MVRVPNPITKFIMTPSFRTDSKGGMLKAEKICRVLVKIWPKANGLDMPQQLT